MKIYKRKLEGKWHVWVGESREEILTTKSAHYRKFTDYQLARPVVFDYCQQLSKQLGLMIEEVE